MIRRRVFVRKLVLIVLISICCPTCMLRRAATGELQLLSSSDIDKYKHAYEDLVRDLPLSPWLNSPNTSERFFPLFVGATPRDLMLGTSKTLRPQLRSRLKRLGDQQVELVKKYLGLKNFYVQAWPTLDEYGQYNWVFARWSADFKSWQWFAAEDVQHEKLGMSQSKFDNPIFPKVLQPSVAKDGLTIFGDFIEQPGLYDQPIYGNCVFVEKRSGRIIKAWPHPYDSDISKWRHEFTQRETYNAYCVNPPSYLNERPYVFTLEVRNGRLIWPQSIDWLLEPSHNVQSLRLNTSLLQWPDDFQKRYVDDVRIAAGEVGALAADGRKMRPFIKRGSFQPDHDMERLVDYLEQRYLALGIETKRQRFNWRGIPQSNLIAKIEGQDSSLAPVILADHFDAAIAEDIYEKTGKRVTVAGASDNATATSLLLQAASMLKNANPKREIMLLHLTGEEFPAVDLGARHFLTQFMQTKRDIHGVVITDFIGRRKPGDHRFNISSAAVKGSERLAAIALGASQDLYPDHELKAVYQSRDVPRNAVFQTDVLEFEFRGFPGILFNEDMDYSNVETFNPHYHQSTDVSANTDFEFSSRVARVAIETVLRIANDP